jgi:competence protein ComEA
MYQSMSRRMRDAFLHMGFAHVDKRIIRGAIAIVAILIVALGALILMRSGRASDSFTIVSGGKTSSADSVAPVVQLAVSDAMSVKTIRVHVVGAVNAPGVYDLIEDSRIIDAIVVAGGSTRDASMAALNLAHRVVDGDQVYLPSIEEVATGKTFYGLAISQLVGSAFSASAGSSGTTTATTTGQSSGTNEKININSATVAQLDELPGVGPVIAQAIITYRESNGPFKVISDLQSVSGIGEKKYAQIIDYVCI